MILVFSDLSLRCTYMTNLQMGGHKFYCSFSDYKSFSQLQFDIKIVVVVNSIDQDDCDLYFYGSCLNF